MNYEYSYEGKLFVQRCIVCGITFGFPTAYDRELRKTHKTFYCPNGHAQLYSGKSKEEELKEQLDSKIECCIRERKRANHAEAQYRGIQGYIAKLKKKISTID